MSNHDREKVLEAALIECAVLSGEDMDGDETRAPTWPPVEVWAVRCVREMREAYDESLAALPASQDAPTDEPQVFNRGDRVEGAPGTGTVVEPANAAGNVGVYWDSGRLNVVEWPKASLLAALPASSPTPEGKGPTRQKDALYVASECVHGVRLYLDCAECERAHPAKWARVIRGRGGGR
jgi:hypothetical protein